MPCSSKRGSGEGTWGAAGPKGLSWLHSYTSTGQEVPTWALSQGTAAAEEKAGEGTCPSADVVSCPKSRWREKVTPKGRTENGGVKVVVALDSHLQYFRFGYGFSANEVPEKYL